LRTIIAGSRDIEDYDMVFDHIAKSQFRITKVISGACSGVDAIGECWARQNGIPFEIYPAEWELHGKSAGPIRNADMASRADALILIWDGRSKGSFNMLKEASKHKLKIYTNI